MSFEIPIFKKFSKIRNKIRDLEFRNHKIKTRPIPFRLYIVILVIYTIKNSNKFYRAILGHFLPGI